MGDADGDEIFLGRDFSTHKAFSEELSSKVDAAIHEIILSADQKAYQILADKLQILHNLAEVLLNKEKITGTEFEAIYNGKTLADFLAAESASANADSDSTAPIAPAPAKA